MRINFKKWLGLIGQTEDQTWGGLPKVAHYPQNMLYKGVVRPHAVATVEPKP